MYPGVWFMCVLCVCVQMPLSSPGAPLVTGPPPALPVSRPPRDLNPATHRGSGFGSGSSPGPTHLGPVATPLQSQDSSTGQRGKPLFRPREGGIPVTFPCVTPYAPFHWLKV